MTDHCANCDEPLRGPFCSSCGQENRNLARLTLRQIFSDWLGDAFTFDSRLLRTLGPLVRKPGFLTSEYLAGRRVRYVPPLRMFVFLSLVMFLAMALVGPKFAWKLTDGEGEEVVGFDPAVGEHSRRSGAEEAAAEELPDIFDDPDEISRRILDRAPQAMLVLVPVFALFVWLLHRRCEPLYTPHLIFSLHLHSFVFLVVLISCFIDLPFPAGRRPGNFLLLFGMPPYLYLAQRRVYGGGWLANLGRTAGLLLAHFIAWLLLMLTVLMLVVPLA